MATDAEVKLNFRAETEEVKTQLAALKALIDGMAEALKGLGVDGATPIPEETLSLIRELTAEVERLRGSYASLQTQFLNLQEVNAGMSTNFIAQIAALSKAVDEARDKCSELYKTISEQNDKLDGQNERIKELEKRLKELPRGGISGFRSLRTVVGNFIIQLFNGKLAVKELGIALKGLAYSTVVLGAIQLAMEGIGWAWEKIKDVFGYSKEEMEAAEEAAKKAREELAEAKKEAEKAADEVRNLQEKLAEKEAAESLKETLAGITAEYVAQRTAVEGTLSAIREAAQVKARERAAEAAAKTGELDMELLGLEERFVAGDIDKRNYVIQKSEIEKRKREEARVAAVDAAEIEMEAAVAQVVAAKAELKNAQDRVTAAEEEAGKYATDDDVKLAEAKYDALHKKVVALRAKADKLESDFLNKYFNKDMTFKSDVFRDSGEYEEERLAVERAKKIADEAGAKQPVMQREVKALKESAARGKEASTRLNEERKTAEKLEKDADAAVKAERKANAALTETLARTAREGGQDDRMTGKRVDIELAKIARDSNARPKEEKERAKLQGSVDKLVRKATRAIADTPKDFTDDRSAFEAIGKFLEDNADAVKQYGVNVSSLLDVTRKHSRV